MSAGSSDTDLMVNRDLDRLAPAFAAAVRAAIEECNSNANRLDAWVYEAYRSPALATMYYQRGRKVKPPERPITNAPTNLHSWHGFGLAVDVIHRNGHWSPPGGDGWFRKVAAIFRKHGCTWGGDWRMADLAHFQWGRCPPSPSDAARAMLTEQGMQAVWARLEAIDSSPASVELVAETTASSNAEVTSSPTAGTATGRARTLGTITGEGFVCTILEDADGRVHYTADADIDADGANGQNGGPAAYRLDDSGTEALANGGMRLVGGKVVCAEPWARDVVILDADNEPRVFAGGVIASTTWYRHPGAAADDPAAYVDAETVPYIVVPPLVVQRTAGIVRGCKARVNWRGRTVDCVVADRGPANRVGEISIAAARAIGLDPSPRHGGTATVEVAYELWPGVAAPGFVLQRA